MAQWITIPLGRNVGLDPSNIVIDVDPDAPPRFSAHVYCGQTAAWIKMPLGMEVGLNPGHTVLDGNQLHLPKKGAEPPQFSVHVYCGQTTARIKMPLSMEVGLGPGNIVLDADSAPLSKRGTASNFRPMSIVIKQLAISATAEHLHSRPYT